MIVEGAPGDHYVTTSTTGSLYFSDDQVYMPDEEDRKEFVECDVGKIYSGNYRQIGSKPWSFGQVN